MERDRRREGEGAPRVGFGVVTPMVLGQSEDFFVSILPWLGLLVLVILVGGGIAIWMRRRMLLDQSASPRAGFTLSDLREMARTGEISHEEFEAAKAQMIAKVRGDAAATVPDPDSAPNGIDSTNGGR